MGSLWNIKVSDIQSNNRILSLPLSAYSNFDYFAEKFYLFMAGAAALGTLGLIGWQVGAATMVWFGALSVGRAWWKNRDAKEHAYAEEEALTRSPLLHDPKIRRISGRLEAYLHKLGIQKKIRVLDIGRLADGSSTMPNAFSANLLNDELEENTVNLATNYALTDALNERELEAVMQHEVGHLARHNDEITMDFEYIKSFSNMAIVLGAVFVNPWLLALLPAQKLIHASFSRHEEFRADRAAVYQTRQPMALAAALTKLNMIAQGMMSEGAAKWLNETIAGEKANLSFPRRVLHEIFDYTVNSHPSLDRRVARLEGMARQIGAEPVAEPQPTVPKIRLGMHGNARAHYHRHRDLKKLEIA